MVDIKNVEKQLKRIKFDGSMWNRAEARELPNILHQDEEIFECANGLYEGGFALLVATNIRLLLIDKKPLNFLTVEDIRFDMINEIDYSHRMLGATITISTGSKTMRFKSYNQPRLRKLINHVQHQMADLKTDEAKKAESQQQHLEEINKQLQMYLMAQHQQLQQQMLGQQNNANTAQANALPKPSPQLSDYLFAQGLLDQFQQQAASPATLPVTPPTPAPVVTAAVAQQSQIPGQNADGLLDDILAEGQKEIFGKVMQSQQTPPVDEFKPLVPEPARAASAITGVTPPSSPLPKSLEINALKIAYSKLPMMLRNRKFGRPSFHAHSQTPPASQTQPAA